MSTTLEHHPFGSQGILLQSLLDLAAASEGIVKSKASWILSVGGWKYKAIRPFRDNLRCAFHNHIPTL